MFNFCDFIQVYVFTINHHLKLNWNQTNFEILGIKFSYNLDTMIEINYKEK